MEVRQSSGQVARRGYVVSFVSQKGGVGKTTLSLNLAGWLAAKNRIAFVDCDPQKSATKWHGLRARSFELFTLAGPALHAEVPRLAREYALVIVDSPPGIATDAATITEAVLSVSDLAIAPVQPSRLDYDSTEDALVMVKRMIEKRRPKLDARLLISRRLSNTVVGKEARAGLEPAGIPVMKTEIYNHVAYIDSIGAGLFIGEYEPNGPAAVEFSRFVREVIQCLRERR